MRTSSDPRTTILSLHLYFGYRNLTIDRQNRARELIGILPFIAASIMHPVGFRSMPCKSLNVVSTSLFARYSSSTSYADNSLFVESTNNPSRPEIMDETAISMAVSHRMIPTESVSDWSRSEFEGADAVRSTFRDGFGESGLRSLDSVERLDASVLSG